MYISNGTQRLLVLVWQCIVLCWSLRGATETSRQTGKAKVRDRRNFVHRIHLLNELCVSNSAQSTELYISC